MMARLSTSLALSLFVLIGSPTAPMAEQAAGYSAVVDDATGIRIDLPLKLLPRVSDTKTGRNWAAADGSINIDTFAYPPDQDFGELYAKLKGVRGRTLTRDERSENRIVIAGRDRDGSGFEVEVRRSGERIRGYSIVYAAKRSQEASTIVRRIAAGFDPFPAAADDEAGRTAAVRQPAAPAAADCTKERMSLQYLASGVQVTFERGGAVKAGEAIKVAWRRGAARFPLDRPVHLVFAMPDTVRFSGQHILPILPSGRSPSGIGFGAGQLRVFLPFAQRSLPESGSFTLTPYRTGRFPIASAVVAKTACGEMVLAQTGAISLDVEAGAPRLVVQDFFSVEQPDRIVVSANGRYRLEIFKASYRVYEVASGIKIVDRAGRHPNFSPAARYVAAYLKGSESTGGAIEVVDLVTAMPVPDLRLVGPIVGWALADSLLIEGTIGWPIVRIRSSLLDPVLRKLQPTATEETEIGLVEVGTSGRSSSAWERFRVKLLLDQGLAVVEDHAPSEMKMLRTEILELASGERIVNELAPNRQERRLALQRYGIGDVALGPGWDLGEPLQLSHYSPPVDAKLSDLAEKDERGRRLSGPPFPRQRSFLVVHRGSTQDGSISVAETSAATAVRGLDWRTRAAGELAARTALDDAGRFAQQLMRYGICERPGCRNISKRRVPDSFVTHSEFLQWNIQYGTQKTTFTRAPAQVERELAADVPAAAKLLDGPPNRICYQEEPEKLEGPIEKRMKFRMIADEKDHTDVHGVWNWSRNARKYWLVQVVCSHAGILNSPVILFVSDPGGAGAIHLLGGSAQVGAGLNKNFDGAPNETVLRIRPSLIDDRWLLIAAPAGNSAAILDLEAPEQPLFIDNIKDAFAVAALLRSSDGRQLVQLNTDGRFHVYRTSDGQPVISGRWIDDEMVLVTERGYYDGSYEGGHFIHLGFAGEEDIFSLVQFEKTLKRPQVVRDVVAGKIQDGPQPTLNVPPDIDLALDRDGAGLVATMQARARSGLKAVRIFDDGELVREIALQGQEASPRLAFDRPPSGRWLAAIAEDQNGLFSAPAVRPNPASTVGGRALHTVVVGVDTYQDAYLKLNYARSDARRLAGALRAQGTGYYSRIEVTELLEERATAEAILAALDAAVRNAKPGDVVLFSFAGHGVQGTDGQLYLTPSGFRSADAMKTGLAWSQIAAVLRRSRARVLVALDACHAGAAGTTGVASNDEAVSALLGGQQAPMIVFAASKGRQFSHEDKPGSPPRWSGGVFTFALVRALTDGKAAIDLNGNGGLEVSELYRAVKSRVVEETRGEQTPWLVRHDLVGDFALF